MNVFQIVAIVLAVVAVVWDLKSRRIPNILTFGGALAAILAHGYLEGPGGAGWSVAAVVGQDLLAAGGRNRREIDLCRNDRGQHEHAIADQGLPPQLGRAGQMQIAPQQLDRRCRHGPIMHM